MPTPPPGWTLTQCAPAAVFTSALRIGQSAIASEPSRIPSVSRDGLPAPPLARVAPPLPSGPGERRPAERSLALAEHRPYERRHEPRVRERMVVRETADLCARAEVVAVVE